MDLLVQELKDYLDNDNRLKAWPGRQRFQGMALEFLASKFETGKNYSLDQVNAIITQAHTFAHTSMLRRELFQNGLLDCTSDGGEFWKVGP